MIPPSFIADSIRDAELFGIRRYSLTCDTLIVGVSSEKSSSDLMALRTDFMARVFA
jgi:hypothetical protein